MATMIRANVSGGLAVVLIAGTLYPLDCRKREPASAASRREVPATMPESLGKQASGRFLVADLATAGEFEAVLMRDLSYYEGHDDQYDYVSSNLPERRISREAVYRLPRSAMSAADLAAMLKRKAARGYRETRQMPVVAEFVEWKARTRPRFD